MQFHSAQQPTKTFQPQLVGSSKPPNIHQFKPILRADSPESLGDDVVLRIASPPLIASAKQEDKRLSPDGLQLADAASSDNKPSNDTGTQPHVNPELAALFADNMQSSLFDPTPTILPIAQPDDVPADDVPHVFRHLVSRDQVTHRHLLQADVDHHHFVAHLHRLDQPELDSLLRYVLFLLRLCATIRQNKGQLVSRSTKPLRFAFQPPQHHARPRQVTLPTHLRLAVVWLLQCTLYQSHDYLRQTGTPASDQRIVNLIRRTLTLARLFHRLDEQEPSPQDTFLWSRPHFFLLLFYQLEAVHADIWFAQRWHPYLNTRYWTQLPLLVPGRSPASGSMSWFRLPPDLMQPVLNGLLMLLRKLEQVQQQQEALDQWLQQASHQKHSAMDWDDNTSRLSLWHTQRVYNIQTAVFLTTAEFLVTQSRVPDARKCMQASRDWIRSWTDVHASLVDVHYEPWLWQQLRDWGWVGDEHEDSWWSGSWSWNQQASWWRPWDWLRWAPQAQDQLHGRLTTALCWLQSHQLGDLRQFIAEWLDRLQNLPEIHPSELVQVNGEHCVRLVGRLAKVQLQPTVLEMHHSPQFEAYENFILHFG